MFLLINSPNRDSAYNSSFNLHQTDKHVEVPFTIPQASDALVNGHVPTSNPVSEAATKFETAQHSITLPLRETLPSNVESRPKKEHPNLARKLTDSGFVVIPKSASQQEKQLMIESLLNSSYPIEDTDSAH